LKYICTLPIAVVDGETVEKAKYSLKTSKKIFRTQTNQYVSEDTVK